MKANRFSQATRRLFYAGETDSCDQERSSGPYRLLLFLSMATPAYFAVKLGQDINWDLLNYHFYSGFAFLHKPLNYDLAPAQMQSFFNPLLHVFTYLMLNHLPSKLAAAILGAIQGLNFYLVFQISQALFRRWQKPYRHLLSLGNALAGFYGTVTIMELGATFGDNLTSLLTLAGLLLILRYLLSDGRRGSLIPLCVAGLMIGIAFGLKLTVFIYAAAIAASLPLAFPAPLRKRVRPVATFYGGLALGFVAAYGIWGLNLYREFRNPVFPYLNAIFRSPFYDLHNTMDARFLPRTWLQALFYPFFFARTNSLACEIEFRDIRLALCYVAVILLAGVGMFRLIKKRRADSGGNGMQRHNHCLLFLTAFFAISYVAWQHLFSIYRYLIVLELLAPAFIALALAALIRRRLLVLAISLSLDLIICANVIPTDFGRQKFNDGFLKVEVPSIRELDKSVVLMVGNEPTSYIVPSFPASTRFVRISSNLYFPGRNAKLDERIRGLLAPYDASHTYVLLASATEAGRARLEASYYGRKLDDRSCREIGSPVGIRGYLCGVAAPSEPDKRNTVPAPARTLVFRKLDYVRLVVTPSEAVTGRDTLHYRVIGLKARTVDMLYTLDGELMPPVRNWALGPQQSIAIFVGADTRKGLYHIIGIRNSRDADADTWIEVDVRARVK